MKPAMIIGLDHVGIVVEDPDAVSSAFERLLGVEPRRRADAEAHFEARVFELSGVEVEVLRFERPIEGVDPAVFHAGPGVQHLAFRVEDVDEATQKLLTLGIEPLRGFPRAGVHGKILFFRDPVTGLLLELVQR
jgi:methylmalonyl-CoA/ethylmalonyl-CoA epimerase